MSESKLAEQIQNVKNEQIDRQQTDGRTDRQNDGQTDGR